MITKEIVVLINRRLSSIVFNLIMIGLSFFILAAAIMFYPEIVQIIFILAFFLIAFWAFLIAAKINHIKDSFDQIAALVVPRSKKK